ncbi:RBBP9/YdeN family alpha/beta hydrolase [Aeromonas lusitana]|uniref:Alpha/beta hydrolase n=1 Tax=Aeromonas lusitana TaxID=931529 RepID=A0A2M8H4V7_9GAMM|nr:alpha/beta hydrolase [Aeromonas lusitana]PJC91551.1 hypothetical protein CUC44_19645 [Aeromonas lusitana]
MKVLILPGIGNSGPDHWQSHWEQANRGYSRVEQRDWDSPVCSDWVASLEASVKHHGEETILVAHSLACLLVAHWAAHTELTIKGALLVAVPDPQGPVFPAQAMGFAPLPMASLPFKSILIASADDPYGDIAHSTLCAASWGSTLVNIGEAGHINGASGLGAWSAGHQWLQELAMA